MPSAFESARSRHGGETLAELLERGPLSLETALRHATDIASALREMHQDGRAHGAIDLAHVVVRSSGVTLLNPERRSYTDPLDDLSGFGLVLYAMLTGHAPAGEELRLVPAKPAVLTGPAAVRAAAMRLAERCLTADRERAPELQKVLTEVRLLYVMAKQFAPEAAGLQLAPPPPPSAPILTVSQSLEVYAGKAPPVINPPPASLGSTPAEAPAPTGASEGASDGASEVESDHESEDEEDAQSKPGENSPATVRARGSHSRPILKDVMCPKCKYYLVRLSRPRTGFERLLNMFGIGVYRCHRCFYRYIPVLGRKVIRRSS